MNIEYFAVLQEPEAEKLIQESLSVNYVVSL